MKKELIVVNVFMALFITIARLNEVTFNSNMLAVTLAANFGLLITFLLKKVIDKAFN
ncbi:MAG: hypothetical protein ACOCQR_01210 [bacterium]